MGNVYISGSTDGTVNWGNGQETGPGPRRSLLLKYNPEGTVLSATTAATGYGRADGVALNSNGDAFIVGMGFNAGTFGTINFQGPVNKYYAYLTKIASAQLSSSEINSTSISLYPNPASDFIYLQGTDTARGSILNMLGQKVADFDMQSSSPINVSGLPQGTYLVKVEGLSAKKFIKE
ncbi:MAG: T9SS type A sorting domain-containing protein [Pedobacter sp.]|nr:MAG: T9SS type A sorting domain-containing protein [Pedobacter sp.]